MTIVDTPDAVLSQHERLDATCAHLAHLAHHYRIGIEDICRLFSVTRDTARRDLVRLDTEGHALRLRSGAASTRTASPAPRRKRPASSTP
jgi:DeoR/GlpR family transcriptional regulator of sugar metabolism